MKIKLTEAAKTAAADMLPAHMVKHVISYFEQGYPPGDFFRAILENDLMEACCRADAENLQALSQYCEWLRWNVPGRPSRWGSREAVRIHVDECFKQNERGEEAALKVIE